MKQVAIKEVFVEALHEQFDVTLRLRPELNVIYGKNGRGKTTLLHILANALEMDFERFRHIQFRTIEITTYEGDSVRISAENPRTDMPLLLEVNGERLAPPTVGAGLSEAEIGLVRAALGSRSVYLPAFRAILERSASDAYPPDRERQSAIEEVLRSEIQISRDSTKKGAFELRRSSEQHRYTAAKTVQCRQWFGAFVPVIRYPSLLDVRARLADEVREASIDVSAFEQHQFSQLFIQVFKSIAGENKAVETGDTEHLLGQVQAALASIEESSGGSENVYAQIRDAVNAAKGSHMPEAGATTRILSLYAELLEQRSAKHLEAFSRIREFERSVNKFLDRKTLKLDEKTAVRMGREGPVLSANGRPMNLSALSSGERQVVTMMFCASRLSVDRGIFLVDEPELSLHVDWQRRILGEVMRQASGRQVIACTHSPEVGAEHYDSVQDFDPALTPAPQDLFSDFDSSEEVE